MVRVRRIAAAVALAIVALTTSRGGSAQTLQRLTVESFTLSSDTNKPQVEVPFHLVVSLQVRERVTAIDNLNLPILAELELLGDERHLVAGASGTQYRETITVVAHHTGAIALAPATLQAVDARDNKPKQWFTNALTLEVGGTPLASLHNGELALAAAARWALQALLWLVGVLCVFAIVVFLFRRRRRVSQPPAPEPPPVAPTPPAAVPARSRRQQLQDALTVLRAEPTRPGAVRVRTGVWRTLGANDGETLADVLVRPEAGEPGMREILRSLERAAFTYDEDLNPAIADACTALERYLA